MSDADGSSGAPEVELGLVPVPAAQDAYSRAKAASAGPRGKFDEGRRSLYLELRRAGVPHLTAVRRCGISPATYDRYSAAVGEAWKQQVRDAWEEGLDPVRWEQRRAALERQEPWAIQAELRKSRSRDEEPSSAVGAGVAIGSLNVLSVSGGAEGVDGALEEMLRRLRTRAAVTAADPS